MEMISDAAEIYLFSQAQNATLSAVHSLFLFPLLLLTGLVHKFDIFPPDIRVNCAQHVDAHPDRVEL